MSVDFLFRLTKFIFQNDCFKLDEINFISSIYRLVILSLSFAVYNNEIDGENRESESKFFVEFFNSKILSLTYDIFYPLPMPTCFNSILEKKGDENILRLLLPISPLVYSSIKGFSKFMTTLFDSTLSLTNNNLPSFSNNSLLLNKVYSLNKYVSYSYFRSFVDIIGFSTGYVKSILNFEQEKKLDVIDEKKEKEKSNDSELQTSEFYNLITFSFISHLPLLSYFCIRNSNFFSSVTNEINISSNILLSIDILHSLQSFLDSFSIFFSPLFSNSSGNQLSLEKQTLTTPIENSLSTSSTQVLQPITFLLSFQSYFGKTLFSLLLSIPLIFIDGPFSSYQSNSNSLNNDYHPINALDNYFDHLNQFFSNSSLNIQFPQLISSLYFIYEVFLFILFYLFFFFFINF
jgi:hypothetical protein